MIMERVGMRPGGRMGWGHWGVRRRDDNLASVSRKKEIWRFLVTKCVMVLSFFLWKELVRLCKEQ